LFENESPRIGMGIHVLYESVYRIFHTFMLFTQFTFGNQLFTLFFKEGSNLDELSFIGLEVFVHGVVCTKNI
jgi:hypothetical protein